MNPAQLLAHFDRLSDAPDAIPRLRRFVLDLAVRGKLVEQDSRDEPAAKLMKRIDTEKVLLVKQGKIRKQELLEDSVEPDIPFELPVGWLWSRLGSIGDWGSGSTPPRGNSEYYGGETTWLKSGELGDCLTLKGSEERVTAVALKKCSFRLNQPGDVLIAMYGATIGKLAILAEPAVTNQAVCGCTPFTGILNRYLFTYLLSRREEFHGQSEGGAQPNISKVKIVQSPFPLPPFAEQQRIVEKVDELMALCDRLESSQAERESRRDRLVASSLNRLNNCENVGAFRDHARFYFNHLPRLTTKPEHIEQLRQSILNLAVRGKLVPQDTRDQHAPEFGIEKETSEANRIQLRLPSSWSWTRVENVAESRLGKMLDKAKNSGKHYRYLRNTNVHWFNIKLEELKVLRIEADEVEKYVLRNGDVLICEGGHGIGRTAVWREAEPKIVFQKALHRVRPGPALNSDFFAYCICVYFHSRVLQTYFTGVGIPHFTGVALSKLVFPLPPLAEQHRIVAKVDELMARCDRLEAQLTTTRTESRRLLEAVLHDALKPALLE